MKALVSFFGKAMLRSAAAPIEQNRQRIARDRRSTAMCEDGRLTPQRLMTCPKAPRIRRRAAPPEASAKARSEFFARMTSYGFIIPPWGICRLYERRQRMQAPHRHACLDRQKTQTPKRERTDRREQCTRPRQESRLKREDSCGEMPGRRHEPGRSERGNAAKSGRIPLP